MSCSDAGHRGACQEAEGLPRLISRWGALKKAPHFSFAPSMRRQISFRERFQGDCSVVKEKKNRLIRRGSIVLAVIGLMTLAGECRAFPYRPAAAVSILSEYAAAKASAPPHTQVWKVVPEVGSGWRDRSCGFSWRRRPRRLPCVNSGFPLPEAPEKSGGKGWGKAGKRKAARACCWYPAFPPPAMFSPSAGDGSGGRVYEERIEAGGRVFSKSYRVSFDPFTVGEAKAMGWIRVEDPGSAGLIMVTVTDEKARPVVKQLWPADGSWWLYEETPLRRSWLIIDI